MGLAALLGPPPGMPPGVTRYLSYLAGNGQS